MEASDQTWSERPTKSDKPTCWPDWTDRCSVIVKEIALSNALPRFAPRRMRKLLRGQRWMGVWRSRLRVGFNRTTTPACVTVPTSVAARLSQYLAPERRSLLLPCLSLAGAVPAQRGNYWGLGKGRSMGIGERMVGGLLVRSFRTAGAGGGAGGCR
jgi:hypothetical protein